jgi:hypothetical protein
MFDTFMDNTAGSSSSDKLQYYLATDIEDIKDPLMWWHEQRKTFPHLSHMARNYLAIPGEYLILSDLILIQDAEHFIS